MKPGALQSGIGVTREISSFIELMQEQYAQALACNDLRGMAETSGTLSITYATLESHELAQRWANEYLDCFTALNDRLQS